MIDFQELKQKLLKEKEEIEILLTSFVEKEKQEIEPVYEVSDIANQYELKEDIHLQQEALKKRLEEIDKALKKIEENTYGFCENCGQPIEEKRLAIDPTTPYCRNCALKLSF